MDQASAAQQHHGLRGSEPAVDPPHVSKFSHSEKEDLMWTLIEAIMDMMTHRVFLKGEQTLAREHQIALRLRHPSRLTLIREAAGDIVGLLDDL
jgi:hypothetical protein